MQEGDLFFGKKGTNVDALDCGDRSLVPYVPEKIWVDFGSSLCCLKPQCVYLIA
jgi:hypothetical protein